MLILVTVAGCARPPSGTAPSRETLSLRIDGLERTGTLRVPASAPGHHRALLVALPAYRQTEGDLEARTDIDVASDLSGTSVLYLSGYAGSWDAGTCCGRARDHGLDDVAVVDDLVGLAVREHGVDPQRVVLVGFSNGGMLAYAIACRDGPRYAGYIVVSGSLVRAGCDPPAGVTLVAVHGALDRTVPLQGTAWQRDLGSPLAGLDQSLDPFLHADRCGPLPALPPTLRGIGRPAVADGCSDGKVTRLVLSTGTHEWAAGTLTQVWSYVPSLPSLRRP